MFTPEKNNKEKNLSQQFTNDHMMAFSLITLHSYVCTYKVRFFGCIYHYFFHHISTIIIVLTIASITTTTLLHHHLHQFFRQKRIHGPKNLRLRAGQEYYQDTPSITSIKGKTVSPQTPDLSNFLNGYRSVFVWTRYLDSYNLVYRL